MQWRKIGKIFDPRDYKLISGLNEFAQSPQALVFEDFVRVYFSTRSRDVGSSNFVSHIAFADFDKSFSTVKRVSDHTVLALGGVGSFDEHGVFPMNVLRHDGKILGYTSGVNRRTAVPVDTAIGAVVSKDQGETFQRQRVGPVLSASLHEPFLVADPFVQVFDGVFHMWYIFGLGWKRFSDQAAPDRIYKIAHATSKDGIHWAKNDGVQVVASTLGAEECQALPTVIKIGTRYHMYFCYRYADNFRTDPRRGYRIGHAVSDDLLRWERDDESVGIDKSPSGWDSQMMCYPHVFQVESRILMLYNGNEFGRHGFGLAELEL